MSTPYICLQCRRVITARDVLSRGTSRPRRRNFVSFNSPEQQTRNQSLKSQRRESQNGDHHPEARQWPRKQSPSQRQHELESIVTDNLLKDLFTSTQRRKPALPLKSRYSKTLNPTIVSGREDGEIFKNDIALLKRMLYVQKAPIAEVWVALDNLQIFGNGAPKPSIREHKLVEEHIVFRDLLFAVVDGRLNASDLSLVPALGEVIGRYVQHDLMGNWWSTVLWRLLRAYSEVEHTLHGKCIAHGLEERAAESLLNDILEVWKVYTETFGDLSRPDTRTGPLGKASLRVYKASSVSPGLSGWSGLPNTKDMIASRDSLPENIEDRFVHFFPRVPMKPTTGSTVLAAVMTCHFLHDIDNIRNSESSEPYEAQPFLRFVAELAKGSKLDNAILQSCALEEELPSSMVNRLINQWDNFQKNVYGKAHEQEQDRAEASNTSRPIIRKLHGSDAGTSQKQRIPTLSIDLRKAVKQSDLKYATKLWDRAKRKIEHHEGITGTLGETFAEFLTSFTALGRPDRAIDVWNTMVRAGCKPSEEHWIAMLDGCKKSRDLPSLQTIWQNNKASGVRISNEMWRMYLSGLLQCRDWQAALKALEELGRAWKDSTAHIDTTPSQNTDTRTDTQQDQFSPSIIPINTAMSGLIALNQGDAAQTVLRWAISQKVKPDISTFNILLRPAVRKDLRDETQRILHAMQKHNCQPDVVTFTILLDGLFRNPTSSFQSQSPEQQQNAVSQIFQDMEENGIEANTYTYGTILDSLLSPRSFNLTAARAVLNRMTERNIKPSPHIYTILITHYFSTSPPNLIAIDSLWCRIQLEKSPIDHVFYDRMIEGYSRIGEIEKMLAFLRRMPREGKTPGWIALLGVLRALAAVEEWNLARDLVTDVVDEKGLFRNGSRGWRGEEEFWGLVGSLRGRGVEVPGRPLKRDYGVMGLR